MKKFGMFVAQNRILILIIALLLLFPSLYGIIMTSINYDILTYLPEELDSMKGQDLVDEVFNNASIGMLVIENMKGKDILDIKDKITEINGVEDVIWISDLLDISIPKEILPSDLKEIFYQKDFTLLMIKFKYTTAANETQEAIGEIRKIINKQCFLSGSSALMKDTIDLFDSETPTYVLLAVILVAVVLTLTMSSTIIPVIFLISIGFAIVYNLGTNMFLGEISHVTKALAAVLQLGVTMDYSIFLLHRYDEELKTTKDINEAMAEAIAKTTVSISGSSITTIAGFLAMVVMKLGLGKDIGIVMAKGVLLGVISTITILPALILTFNKLIHRFKHKTILPNFKKTSYFVTKYYKIFIILFLLLFLPAIYGEFNTESYYNILDESLPQDMDSIVSLNKLKEEFNMTTTHMIVINDDIPSYKKKELLDKIEKLPGIKNVIAYDKFIGPTVPDEFIPDDLKDIFKKEGYNLILVNSKYKSATDEQNAQLDEINNIIKSYDENGLVTGEGALTKDLIQVANIDFKNVNIISIILIFIIIMFVFQSISLPVLLVCAIEFAIFINMSIPYYMGIKIPFIASIVIGCIQLGATVDYAILLTTRFREEIRNGYEKHKAMKKALEGSIISIVTSGLTFFGATIGVVFISDIDLISSLVMMISRGAIISMIVIIVMLPAILLISEKFVSATTRNWKNKPKLKFKKGEI